MNKLVCLVGMTGSGKSIVADHLVTKGFAYVRFGQITMDLIKERGLEVNEANEKLIREEVRVKYGMSAFAVINEPKISGLLIKGSVVADGLYSWSEYKYLKQIFKEKMVVVAVFSSPKTRYARLEERVLKESDTQLRNRPSSKELAQKRDYAEIENIEKGGPIAMADFTLLNTSSVSDLVSQVDACIELILSESDLV